jgi:hypothetical protein
MAQLAVDNLVALLSGGEPKTALNPEARRR